MPNKESAHVAQVRITKSLWTLAALVGLFASSGATCNRQMMVNPFAAPGPVAPQILPEVASRDQIIAAVNQNSSRIQSISVTGATITIPDMLGLPLLNGNIAAERPARFRLTAGTAVTGQEIDIGSNDELFWMWVKRNTPPAVYFCRHAQFANSNIRQMMPVEPSWLLAALGIVDIEPASVFAGPTPQGDGNVEMRTWLQSSSGPLQRVLVINARTAQVVGQYVYDQPGKVLLASAVAESHRYYPIEQVSLPDVISIRLPTANMALKINLGAVQINQLTADRTQLWTMPAFEGTQQFDLGGAALGQPLPGSPVGSAAPAAGMPTAYPSYPSATPASPYPVTPASATSSLRGARTAEVSAGPLPIYGRRY